MKIILINTNSVYQGEITKDKPVHQGEITKNKPNKSQMKQPVTDQPNCQVIIVNNITTSNVSCSIDEWKADIPYTRYYMSKYKINQQKWTKQNSLCNSQKYFWFDFETLKNVKIV